MPFKLRCFQISRQELESAGSFSNHDTTIKMPIKHYLTAGYSSPRQIGSVARAQGECLHKRAKLEWAYMWFIKNTSQASPYTYDLSSLRWMSLLQIECLHLIGRSVAKTCLFKRKVRDSITSTVKSPQIQDVNQIENISSLSLFCPNCLVLDHIYLCLVKVLLQLYFLTSLIAEYFTVVRGRTKT